MNYLQVDNLTKSYGDLVLFENLNLSIDKDQRAAIIAKNGAGKTSLLKTIAGVESADSGQIILRNDITIGYLEQIPHLNNDLTVIEEVFQSSNEMVAAIKEYEKACTLNNSERLAQATQQMDRLKAWDYEVKVKQILGQLNIHEFNQKVSELSGGQKKRLALANVLINEPDILIMDEPTNHLDLEMIEWLEGFLKNANSTLIMVTHDRYFLDRVCSVIYELDNKQLFKYKGNYSYFLEKRAERIHNENTEIEKARALFKKELDWINRSPSARTTKAKYRVDAFEDVKETANKKKHKDNVQIEVKSARLGKKILELNNLKKRFDDTIILDDFTYNFKRYEKVGIVGGNGSGKTTFLNLIAGDMPLDSGKIDIGSTVVLGYYKQDGMRISENKKLIEVIEDIAENINMGDGRKLSPIQFLNYFLFQPKMHHAYVSKLSGGEKRRLYLMTVLMQNPNFLILDEPTNDLDIMTLNVLEDYLKQFKGCVLIVSHDRFFMDKIVDHLFVFKGEGKIKDYPGNYSQYREWSLKQQNQQNKSAKPEKTKKQKTKPQEKTKLTFKEKEEFEKLELEIEELELEKEKIEQNLSSAVYEGQELVDAAHRLSEVTELLDKKSDRWLELSQYV